MPRLKISVGLLLLVALVVSGATLAGAQERGKGKDDDNRRRGKPQEMRLRCEGRTVEGAPVIGCVWSKSERRDFAGYTLTRQADRSERKPVFRTRDRDQTRYRDRDVRSGKYVYVVDARNRDGKVIGRSQPAKVECCAPSASTTPSSRPSSTTTSRPSGRTTTTRSDGQMRFQCVGRATEGKQAVGCKWSGSEDARFARYRLYRQTEAADRKVVFETTDRDRTGFVDNQVRRGVTYVYAVETLAADGAVIGRGGPQRVACCRQRADADGAPRR